MWLIACCCVFNLIVDGGGRQPVVVRGFMSQFLDIAKQTVK